jgi:hypothetical protein
MTASLKIEAHPSGRPASDVSPEALRQFVAKSFGLNPDAIQLAHMYVGKMRTASRPMGSVLSSVLSGLKEGGRLTRQALESPLSWGVLQKMGATTQDIACWLRPSANACSVDRAGLGGAIILAAA